jgi:hypothetical protein
MVLLLVLTNCRSDEVYKKIIKSHFKQVFEMTFFLLFQPFAFLFVLIVDYSNTFIEKCFAIKIHYGHTFETILGTIVAR